MANENSKILTAEKEKQLRQPIEDYVGKIQKKIDSPARPAWPRSPWRTRRPGR